MQNSTVPIHTLEKLQFISYQFVQGAQREVVWVNMVLPKQHGGMGVKDFRGQQTTTIETMHTDYGQTKAFG